MSEKTPEADIVERLREFLRNTRGFLTVTRESSAILLAAAAAEIEALRAREAELQRKLDEAVKALEWIRLGDTEVFDDDLECLVTVSADSEELSTAADNALASIREEG